MSEISREDVKHLATLARIELNATELDIMSKQLDAIVDAVATVKEVASADIPATSHPIPLKNVFRADIVGESLNNKEVLSQAPDSEDGRFKVPAILEEE